MPRIPAPNHPMSVAAVRTSSIQGCSSLQRVPQHRHSSQLHRKPSNGIGHHQLERHQRSLLAIVNPEPASHHSKGCRTFGLCNTSSRRPSPSSASSSETEPGHSLPSQTYASGSTLPAVDSSRHPCAAARARASRYAESLFQLVAAVNQAGA